jgi:hypothetical protein
MAERFGVPGTSLAEALAKGRRRLPRAIEREAQILVDAAARANIPQLSVQIDRPRVAQAYDRCLAHLKRQGRGARRLGYLLQVLSSIAFGLIVLGAGVVTVLVWRDLL